MRSFVPRPAAPVVPVELEPGYQLEHFDALVQTLTDGDLEALGLEDARRLKDLCGRPSRERALVLRLFGRKGCCALRSSLQYPEIDDRDRAIEGLADAGWIGIGAEALEILELPSALDRYARALLDPCARALGIETRGRKGELIERLAELDPRVVLCRLADADPLVALIHGRFLTRLCALFFADGGRALTPYVVADVGYHRPPRYEIDRRPSVFTCSDHLDAFLQATALARVEVDALDCASCLEAADRALTALQQRFETRVWPMVDPAAWWSRHLFELARRLERLGEKERAVELHEVVAGRAPEASVRAKALERLGVGPKKERVERFARALEASHRLGPPDEISAHVLRKRAHRLGLGPDPDLDLMQPRRVRSCLHAGPRTGARPTYAARRGADAETIERAVLEALGGQGIRSENLLFRTLFGLFFWDMIFEPRPGVLVQPFQRAPLDFDSDHFGPGRRDALAARAGELRAMPDLGAALLDAWHQHHGEGFDWVRWDVFEPEILVEVVQRLGPPVVDVLEWIGRHPRKHTRGFPDLIVWSDGHLRFVEVKGPGDALRLEQRIVHHVLSSFGFDVELLEVELAPAVDLFG